MNKTVIGICNLCGGKVSAPAVWHSIGQISIACESCGATLAQFSTPLPILNMRNSWPICDEQYTTSMRFVK